MTPLNIQDVYAISMKLHSMLVTDKIHYARNEEAFRKIWQNAIIEMQALLIARDFDLQGNHLELLNGIDWEFKDTPMHHG